MKCKSRPRTPKHFSAPINTALHYLWFSLAVAEHLLAASTASQLACTSMLLITSKLQLFILQASFQDHNIYMYQIEPRISQRYPDSTLGFILIISMECLSIYNAFFPPQHPPTHPDFSGSCPFLRSIFPYLHYHMT